MGTWGPHSNQSDHALDAVCEIEGGSLLSTILRAAIRSATSYDMDAAFGAVIELLNAKKGLAWADLEMAKNLANRIIAANAPDAIRAQQAKVIKVCNKVIETTKAQQQLIVGKTRLTKKLLKQLKLKQGTPFTRYGVNGKRIPGCREFYSLTKPQRAGRKHIYLNVEETLRTEIRHAAYRLKALPQEASFAAQRVAAVTKELAFIEAAQATGGRATRALHTPGLLEALADKTYRN